MMIEMHEAGESDTVLGRVSKIIAAQTAGTPSGFAMPDLEHVYLDLVRGGLCVKSRELLVKMLGPKAVSDWEDEEPDGGYIAGKSQAMAESIREVDLDEPMAAIAILSSALMVACRELGWIEASAAAHEQWFHAGADD